MNFHCLGKKRFSNCTLKQLLSSDCELYALCGIFQDMHYYQSCLEAILQNSPDAKVFCLVHKMDLVQDDQRDLVSKSEFHLSVSETFFFEIPFVQEIQKDKKFLQIFREREEDLKRLSKPLECSCFATSIWDETLYKVKSAIRLLSCFDLHVWNTPIHTNLCFLCLCFRHGHPSCTNSYRM